MGPVCSGGTSTDWPPIQWERMGSVAGCAVSIVMATVSLRCAGAKRRVRGRGDVAAAIPSLAFCTMIYVQIKCHAPRRRRPMPALTDAESAGAIREHHAELPGRAHVDGEVLDDRQRRQG